MFPTPASMLLVPVTVSAPDWLIAPLLLLALRLPPIVPMPRFNVPWLFAVKAPVLSVPRLSAFLSLIETLLPVRSTAPPKSLPASVSAMLPTPASMLLVPVTVSAPDWPIAPLLLVALRFPPIVPVPRFNAPALLAVRLPVASAPRVKVFASVICTLLPARFTAPVKSLVTPVRRMSPVPASMSLLPATSSVPPVWLIEPPSLPRLNVPLAVMSF